MEQKGVFRSALGGFHKQDVLNYIDGITAEWNEERQQLAQQAEADRTLAQQEQENACREQEKAQQEQRKAQEATAALEAAQAENAALTAHLEELETELAALRRLPEEVRQLTEHLQEVTAQLDVVLAEKAKLTEQLHMETDRANTATNEMMAAEARLQQKDKELGEKNEQLASANCTLDHYRSILGNAADAGQRVGNIARPYVQQAGQQAEGVLTDVENALSTMLLQLSELQSIVDEKKATLQTSIIETDSRLTNEVEAWIHTANEAARPSDDNVDFFR